MNLDEEQKKKVAAWLAEGLRLSDIQQRLASELGVNLTYMEVRFLVDDLKMTPKDMDPPKTAVLSQPPSQPSNRPPQPGPTQAASPLAGQPSAPTGGISLKVDQIARPGTVVSGNVTFSDGNTAEWYLDQMGRLGLVPQQQGYRPTQPDVMAFQAELQQELARLGF